jgi:hypothetical protein
MAPLRLAWAGTSSTRAISKSVAAMVSLPSRTLRSTLARMGMVLRFSTTFCTWARDFISVARSAFNFILSSPMPICGPISSNSRDYGPIRASLANRPEPGKGGGLEAPGFGDTCHQRTNCMLFKLVFVILRCRFGFIIIFIVFNFWIIRNFVTLAGGLFDGWLSSQKRWIASSLCSSAAARGIAAPAAARLIELLEDLHADDIRDRVQNFLRRGVRGRGKYAPRPSLPARWRRW